ncbi:MAG TPA: hypothetical protein VHN99_06855 [Deinococcales bacterium]|nr:hypothetical protein [Deinococcales bacterium]
MEDTTLNNLAVKTPPVPNPDPCIATREAVMNATRTPSIPRGTPGDGDILEWKELAEEYREAYHAADKLWGSLPFIAGEEHQATLRDLREALSGAMSAYQALETGARETLRMLVKRRVEEDAVSAFLDRLGGNHAEETDA